MKDARLRARVYAREHGEDAPEISGWQWWPEAVATP
jgi:xylulose-5-phosphate/fructose-6-phosphate phosphoketolase